ncbi:oxidoreductase [Virgisporangium aliadipatigenens]|uniref:Oxidoreductase n=1 Tax=Virgisporangium aliadipatigenens TaxID=741659 RepID=A0A8J3YRV0_9ACTN|nr:ferric reductase-like transmembrane domain-containing protein [Virgisporangium aliadipatigenens]GIJ48795.1 oxidoreductase [Virgisporangium aliadipatigenens]
MTAAPAGTHRPVPAPARPAATPAWWADVVGFAIGASALVVTTLWVRNGGVQALLAGGPALAASVGRLTGLLAADLMLLQVLLMARVPMVERAFGQDRLVRWHRVVGFVSFNLMLVHIQWTVFGAVGVSGDGFGAVLSGIVLTYPGLLPAAAGSVLLVVVVVVSVRAARRRLRYESWHLVHLYAYAGVGLALPHQVWNGRDFTGSPAARAYWWSLYALCAGAVVVFRLGVPLWRNLLHRLRVSDVVDEGAGITSVYLSGKHLERLPVRAGQYFTWRFLDGNGWTWGNPFSLSATPDRDRLRISVKNVGDATARVARLRPGTRVLIEGPFGKLTGESYDGGPVVLLACGIGITPMLSLLGELPYGPDEATLLYRVRNEAEAVFREELAWYAAHRGVRVVYLVGPRAERPSWLPRDLADDGDVTGLTRVVPGIAGARVYVCGPEAWADRVAAAAGVAGVPAECLHTEKFSW